MSSRLPLIRRLCLSEDPRSERIPRVGEDKDVRLFLETYKLEDKRTINGKTPSGLRGALHPKGQTPQTRSPYYRNAKVPSAPGGPPQSNVLSKAPGPLQLFPPLSANALCPSEKTARRRAPERRKECRV